MTVVLGALNVLVFLHLIAFHLLQDELGHDHGAPARDQVSAAAIPIAWVQRVTDQDPDSDHGHEHDVTDELCLAVQGVAGSALAIVLIVVMLVAVALLSSVPWSKRCRGPVPRDGPQPGTVFSRCGRDLLLSGCVSRS